MDDKDVGIVRMRLGNRISSWFITEMYESYNPEDVLVKGITYSEAEAILKTMGENEWRSNQAHTGHYLFAPTHVR